MMPLMPHTPGEKGISPRRFGWLGSFAVASSLCLFGAVAQAPAGGQGGSSTTIQVRNVEAAPAAAVLRAGGLKSVEVKSSDYLLAGVRVDVTPDPQFADMIVASASIDKDVWPPDLLKVKFNWTLFVDGKVHDKVLTWPDGTKIAWSAGLPTTEREFTLVLTTSCLFGKEQMVRFDGKDLKVVVDADVNTPEPVRKVVKIIQVGPNPPPPGPNPLPPGPNPPIPPAPRPDPIFPPGQFGLAKFIYDAVKADTLMDAREKAAVARELATSYGGTAAQIVAVPAGFTVESAFTTSNANNAQAIARSGVAAPKTQMLKAAITAKFRDDLYQKNLIKTASDAAVAFQELAAGLSEVKE